MKTLRYGSHVWIKAGVVHPDRRLRGIIVKPICEVSPPEHLVAFIWPQEKDPSVWRLDEKDLDPMSAVDILAQVVGQEAEISDAG